MRNNKRGSMELGVNSIVVLIIALALLGLGIAFITNLFKGGQDKLGGLIDRTDLPIHADASTPIMFDSSDLTIKSGSSGKVVISVYNSGLGEADQEIGIVIAKCVDSSGNPIDTATEPLIKLASPEQKIKLGTDGGYKAIIQVAKIESDVFEKGTYICTVVAGPVDNGVINFDSSISQQLFVNVVV